MKIAIVIPARYKSSRFPGKPLATIKGKEMILRVLEICKKVLKIDDIYVATENKLIKKKVNKYGFKVIMTSSKCKTGTDRLAEAAKKIKAKIFINVQGDEPLIKPQDIKKIILAKKKYPNKVICGYTTINEKDSNNKNIPKVLFNIDNELIYMSRLPIPGSKNKIRKNKKYFKQVCVYAFNKNELNKFYNFGKKSIAEQQEDIELLRFFDLGIPVQMIKLSKGSIAVDVKADIKKVEFFLTK